MVLITGGLGYLGSRIAKYLIEQGYSVRIATSRTHATVPLELSDSQLVNIDLQNSGTLDAACNGVSTIIHLAAMNAQSSKDKPEQAIMVNSLGTLNLLKSAKKCNIDRFIYFSTAHVYGNPLVGLITEKTLPHPSHPYSITHRTAEDYVYEYSMSGDFYAVIFRLSNAIGYPLSKDIDCWSLVSNDLVKQLILKNKMTLHSSAWVERDFIAISDICRAVNFMLKFDQIKRCETYNLGSGNVLSLKALSGVISKKAEKLITRKPTLDFKDTTSQKDLKNLNYSIEKLKATGFCIDNDIEKEIEQLIIICNKWF